MTYNIVLDEIRTSIKDGIKYAIVRAVANGPDSYKSVFTTNARMSLIDQLKQGGVKVNAQHKNAILGNIETYLKDRYSKSYGSEKEDLIELLGQIPNMDFPIGKVIDAYFLEDNVVEAVIEENYALKLLGREQTDYLNGAWDMIENGFLSGVSLVFNDLMTTMSGENLIIDDLHVKGLDFVDRAAHKDTRVVETFMRAMQDSSNIPPHKDTNVSDNKKMTNETEIKKDATQIVDVDEIVDKASAKLEEKKEAEAKLEADKQAIRDEYELKLKEKDDAITSLAKEKEEVETFASEAVKAAEQVAASIDNPFAQRAKEAAEASNDPLKDKTFEEVVALKMSQR